MISSSTCSWAGPGIGRCDDGRFHGELGVFQLAELEVAERAAGKDQQDAEIGDGTFFDRQSGEVHGVAPFLKNRDLLAVAERMDAGGDHPLAELEPFGDVDADRRQVARGDGSPRSPSGCRRPPRHRIARRFRP